ncbi:uncharacterized protein B0H64DRAFT_469461 [Chaetomium fimeti]|uniref:Uncharacterized protein n=1 Tax=Chaetomium fimeti TaxID=1854472 RepID=A0AAE0H843_9PEZI|nr:hypothetical protein B0H64DRAFT_469461 [Chaetomium fimeti]
MVRLKCVSTNQQGRSRSNSVQGHRASTEVKTAKASTPEELALVDTSLCETVPGVHDSKATFLIQPQDNVEIFQKLRPFVVTVSNPPGKMGSSLQRYKATVAIYYQNSALKVVDPSPVVEHTDRPIPSARALFADHDGKGNIHFIFKGVKINYLGEYTMHASIFRPDDDIEGPAFLTTPWSTSVKVVPPSRRREPAPLSKSPRRNLVSADLGIHVDFGHADLLETHETEDRSVGPINATSG